MREWLRGGGFHAAYVTDHRRFEGAAAAVAGNPPRAGGGVSMFSGIEVISARLHLNVLGATIADSAYFRHRVVGPDSIRDFQPADGGEPVILLRVPGWRAMPPDSLDRGDPAVSWLGLAGAVPEFAWLMLRTLSWPERAAWIARAWGVWLAAWAARTGTERR